MVKIVKYIPYIVPLGNGLYQINSGRFSYVTGLQGAIEADEALRAAAKKYCANVE